MLAFLGFASLIVVGTVGVRIYVTPGTPLGRVVSEGLAVLLGLFLVYAGVRALVGLTGIESVVLDLERQTCCILCETILAKRARATTSLNECAVQLQEAQLIAGDHTLGQARFWIVWLRIGTIEQFGLFASKNREDAMAYCGQLPSVLRQSPPELLDPTSIQGDIKLV